MGAKINVSRQQLQNLYVDKGMSADAVAKVIGVSVPTVISNLRQYGIEVRSPKVKFLYDPSELRRLYVDEGLTQLEIATRWGVHQVSVGDWLRDLGIKGRRVGKQQSVFLPEDELRRMYLDEKVDIRDIRAHFKCGTGTITRTLRAMGILRSHEDRQVVRTDKLRTARSSPYLSGEKEYIPQFTNKGYKSIRTLDRKHTGEHILVAEKAMGRPVVDGEVVHHINMRKLDNVPENLAVLTRNEHFKLHHYMQLVGAFLTCAGAIRPAPLNFGHEVFWGGKDVTSIDLIGQRDEKLREAARLNREIHEIAALDHGAIPDLKETVFIN